MRTILLCAMLATGLLAGCMTNGDGADPEVNNSTNTTPTPTPTPTPEECVAPNPAPCVPPPARQAA